MMMIFVELKTDAFSRPLPAFIAVRVINLSSIKHNLRPFICHLFYYNIETGTFNTIFSSHCHHPLIHFSQYAFFFFNTVTTHPKIEFIKKQNKSSSAAWKNELCV